MFKVTVKDKNNEWTEEYPNSGKKWDVSNQSNAEIIGKSFVFKFNQTLRLGENSREFIKAEFLGDDPVKEAEYKDEDGDAI